MINKYGQLVTRLCLGGAFIEPVLDRFGFLGQQSPGITWGNWRTFVNYTNTLLPFLSLYGADITARVTTMAEVLLAICLIIGFKTRMTATVSALSTALLGIYMLVFLGPFASIAYPVFVFTGGAILLFQINEYKWSLDEYLSPIERKPPSAPAR